MKRGLLGALLVLAVLVTSGHRFANEFVFDDVHVIRDGSVIHDPSQLFAVWTHHTMFASSSDPGSVQSVDTYRPVPITLFMMDAAISGRSPWAYHLTNLILHILCVLGVFFVGQSWLERPLSAFYGAIIFAVHPWAVEAHVWINGRSDPACLAFGLAAMLALLAAESTGSGSGSGSGSASGFGWRALAAGLLLLGLLSKETLLLVFPAILLMPGPRLEPLSLARRIRTRLPSLAVPAVAYLAIRALVLGGMQTHRDATMLGDAARNLPWLLLDALRQAIVPARPYLRSLRDEYATVPSWQIIIAAVIVALILIAAIRGRRRAPVVAWTALWFFVPMAPIAIISTVLWPGFGRYLYIPLAGFAWCLGALADHAPSKIPRAAARRLLAGAHILILAALTALATHDFRDSESLYGITILSRPDVAMGHGWLGMARAGNGRTQEAIPPLMRAVELDPGTQRYLLHAGRAVLTIGDRPNAALLAERGIHRFRDSPEEAAFHLLAINSMSSRDDDVARAHLQRCLAVWPDRPDCAAALATLDSD